MHPLQAPVQRLKYAIAALATLIVAVALGVGALVGVGHSGTDERGWEFDRQGVPDPTESPSEEGQRVGGEPLRVLVMGLDQRGTEVPRADAIVVAQFDPGGRRLAALWIPRDLYVDVPGHGLDRVNTAYAFGSAAGGPGGGAALTQAIIERDFQLSVDHYVAVGFRCFEEAVDAVGGVEVDVPRRLVDTAYPDGRNGVRTVRFEPGRQWLTGEEALVYVRMRHPDSDFGRIERQRQVLEAFKERLRDPSALVGLASLAARGCDDIATDLSVAEGLDLARRLAFFEGQVVLNAVTPDMVENVVTPEGAWVLKPHWPAIRDLVKRTFHPSPS